MKTIYVLRHAKTELGDAGVSDHERKLLPRGVEDAENLGRFLAEKGISPAQVLCSSSARTRETLARLQQHWMRDAQAEIRERLYLASCGDLFQELQGLADDADSALLIGHNPGLHQFGLMLHDGSRSEVFDELEFKLPTCGLVVAECNILHWSQLQPGCGALRAFYTRHDVIAALAA